MADIQHKEDAGHLVGRVGVPPRQAAHPAPLLQPQRIALAVPRGLQGAVAGLARHLQWGRGRAGTSRCVQRLWSNGGVCQSLWPANKLRGCRSQFSAHFKTA